MVLAFRTKTECVLGQQREGGFKTGEAKRREEESE